MAGRWQELGPWSWQGTRSLNSSIHCIGTDVIRRQCFCFSHSSYFMKKIYRRIERLFETVALTAIAILGNAITFIVAMLTVIFWLVNKPIFNEDIHSRIGDLILGVTF